MTGAPGMLAPGGVIGMLGGGQLGRMTALAAARLGYRVHVFTPEAASPCAQVSAAATVAAFEDRAALAAFADAVDVVTLEWENIPVETLAFLAERRPVAPGAAVLEVTQDRVREKDFVTGLGIATAPYRAVGRQADAAGAVAAVAGEAGRPGAILKTVRMGYDGKGQRRVEDPAAAAGAWQALGGVALIAEGIVDFAMEVSVVVARGRDGTTAAYPPVENRHAHHILATTIAPAPISAALSHEAEAIARRIADALGLVGVLAVEMFVTRDGRLLVNELAPRPHNSGHWTIDACASSQFEQQVRAVCGLPLGSTERVADAVMENLIGDQVDDWPRLLADPGARLHLYGKAEARPGRKMGHVTRLVRPAGS